MLRDPLFAFSLLGAAILASGFFAVWIERRRAARRRDE
jgi:hypothetical protein